MARWLIGIGLVLVATGLVLYLAPGLLGWFGRLPGDVRIETARGRFHLPVTSMLIVSVVLTLLVNLFRR